MNNVMKQIISVCLLISAFGFSVLAQDEGTISGKIVDAKTGEPLIGANVVVDDSTGTATDLDGNFTIKLKPGLHKILCRFLGCDSQTQNITITSGENFTLNVALKESTEALGQVVISAGKFEQKIEEVTVSMAVIDPELVENKGTTNMQTAVNQVPGVQIIDSEPQIRSGSGYSFGAGSRVMIMVDDLPILSGDAGRPAWNFLPVENLEQIEIIKGASSVLYGSAALSGVINIRTAYPRDEPQSKLNVYSGIYDNPSRKHAIYWGNSNPIYTGMNFFHSRKIGNWDLVIGGNMFGDNGYVGSAPEDISVHHLIQGSPLKKDTVYVNGLPVTGTGSDTTVKYLPTGIGEFENRTRMNANIRYRHPKIEGLNFGINVNGMYSRSAGALLMLDTDSGMYRSFPGAITTTLKLLYNIDPYVNYYDKGGGKHSLRTRVYYVDNRNTSDREVDQSNKSTLYYGQYQYQKKFENLGGLFKDMVLTSGIMGTYSESNSILYLGNDAGSPINFSRNYAIFTQLDKKLWDRVTVSLGTRYEGFEINETDKEAKPVFRSGVSTRIFKETYVRASYGEGFRFPTIAEKYIRTAVGPMNIYPNNNITAEKSWNAEIGAKQGFKLGNFLGYLDVAAFQQEIQNSIEFNVGRWGQTSDPLIGLGFKSINVGLARIRGLDMSIVGEGKIGNFEIRLLAGHTFTVPVAMTPDNVVATRYIDDKGILWDEWNENIIDTLIITYKNSSSDTTNDILKYRYEHLTKVDVNVLYKKFAFGASYRFTSFMRNVDKVFLDLDEGSGIQFFDGVLPTGISNYRDSKNGKGDYVIDIRVRYELSETVKVSFIVNNLLNREYMIRPLTIEAPRTGQLQFTINF